MDYLLQLGEEKLFLYLPLVVGLLYGFIAQREQFCFSGGIKDFILFKQTKRTASMVMAMIVAIVATQYIGQKYEIDFEDSRYFQNINYLFIAFGGVLFGIGMMLSDGCSSRHLIKLVQGEKDSFFILLALGIFSFITYSFLGEILEVIRTNPFVVNFQVETTLHLSQILIVSLLGITLVVLLKNPKNILQIWDGLLIGLVIALGWFVTHFFINEFFWEESLQSLSFVYPLGKVIEYSYTNFSSSIILFPVLVMIGVMIGAFISSLFNKKYAKKQMCDTTGFHPPKLWLKMVGGALMGFGGILALGCTVGEGLSGLSSLSFASLIAIGSIYIAGVITAIIMKKKNSLIACFYFDYKEQK